jgi:hypothetical protein
MSKFRILCQGAEHSEQLPCLGDPPGQEMQQFQKAIHGLKFKVTSSSYSTEVNLDDT